MGAQVFALEFPRPDVVHRLFEVAYWAQQLEVALGPLVTVETHPFVVRESVMHVSARLDAVELQVPCFGASGALVAKCFQHFFLNFEDRDG